MTDALAAPALLAQQPHVRVEVDLDRVPRRGNVAASHRRRNWQKGGITSTSYTPPIEAVGKFYFLDQSWQDPNVIYAGRYKTTNGGASWAALSGIYSVVAVSRRNHDVLYAYSAGANSDGIVILRSDDGGRTWRTWYAKAAGYRTDSRPVVCIDPQDHDTLYAIDRTNYDIVRVAAAGAPPRTSACAGSTPRRSASR